MVLERIECQGFRNLADAELTFCDDLNYISGDNGAGKTNLLEAIFYACNASSFRSSDDQSLVRFDSQYFRIEARAAGDRRGAVYVDAQRKRLTLAGNNVSRMSDFIGWLGVVIMSIDDIWIVRGSPSKRRAFLDWAIAKTSAAYAADLAEYRKVMRQRNRHLQMRAGNGAEELLEALDERLIQSANEIYRKREAALPDLKRKFVEFGAGFGLDRIDLNYESVCENMRMNSDMLKRVRAREFALGQTVIGPHRDDLLLSIDGRPMQHYASEGEERAASVALRLAEADMLHRSKGDRPILLLDEVSAELDRKKREILFGLLQGQVFYASTQPPDPVLAGRKAGLSMRIEKGAVEVS